MRSMEDEERRVNLTHEQMVFNEKECQILTIRDVSAQHNLMEVKRENQLLNLVTSSVSHELITPIKCISAMANEMITEILKDSNAIHKAKMILTTSQLLQAQIKMLLDKSLLENGQF